MSKIIIYHYTYIHGGLADFLKFLFHTIDLCEIHDLSLRIHVNHPIQKYIHWNKDFKKLCVDHIPNYAYFIGSRNAHQTFNDIVSHHDCIVICSLDFFSYNIQYHGLANELNFRTTTRSFVLEDYMDLLSFPGISLPSRPFVCIHIRMGDKYASILPSVEYCDQDDRSIEITKLHGHVSNILSMTDQEEFDIFFMSDNLEMKKEIISTYPILKSVMTDIGIGDEVILNISYPIQESELFQKGLEMSIYEFQILRRAQSIYALSYSGFAIMANHLKLNQEQQLFQLYDI